MSNFKNLMNLLMVLLITCFSVSSYGKNQGRKFHFSSKNSVKFPPAMTIGELEKKVKAWPWSLSDQKKVAIDFSRLKKKYKNKKIKVWLKKPGVVAIKAFGDQTVYLSEVNLEEGVFSINGRKVVLKNKNYDEMVQTFSRALRKDKNAFYFQAIPEAQALGLLDSIIVTFTSVGVVMYYVLEPDQKTAREGSAKITNLLNIALEGCRNGNLSQVPFESIDGLPISKLYENQSGVDPRIQKHCHIWLKSWLQRAVIKINMDKVFAKNCEAAKEVVSCLTPGTLGNEDPAGNSPNSGS